MKTKADRIAGEVRKRKIVRPKDLSSLAGSRSHLWNLARSGKIDRIGRGLYRDRDSPISDNEAYVELAKRVPEGVLCLSSALRYHELTTENPSEIWLAIERGAWTPKIDFPPFESHTSRSRPLTLASRFIRSMVCNFASAVRPKP